MIVNYTINNVFEEILNINWDISNFQIDVNDFILDTTINKYIYTLNINHLNAIQNVKNLTNIKYVLIPGYDTSNIGINLLFRYSFDNNTFSSYIPVNETNLSTITDKAYLWLDIQIVIVIDNPSEITFPITDIKVDGTRYLDVIYDASIIGPGELKVYTSQDTYKVFKTTSYDVYLRSGDVNNLEIYFRYTQNQGRNWSDWLLLTDYNLQRQQYIRVKFCDFQFGFRNKGQYPIELYDLELNGEFQNITGNYTGIGKYGLKTQCNPIVNTESPCSCDDINNNANKTTCAPCSTGNTPWNSCLSTMCSSNNVTNLNDAELMSPLIERQQVLNEYAEAKNSWTFEYFYTDPDRKGVDTILHEYQLSNVILKRNVNVMVPDNQFPNDQITFSGFGMDLVVSFEVHILRSTFKKIFGVEARPRTGDYMHLCNTNLMYEVEQVLDKKDIMNASFYWRVILKKYEQKASRKFAKTQDGTDAKNFTDALVKYTTLDNLFSETNINELNENNLENTTDMTQQANDLVYGQYTLYKEFSNKLQRISDTIWNASSIVSNNQYKIPYKSKNEKIVTYTYKDNVSKIDNRAFSMWCKFEQYDPTFDITLLSNYDYTNNLGYKINLFNGGLEITINGIAYSVHAPIQNDIWYCFYIGVNQSKNELELSIYKRQAEDGKLLSNNNLIKLSTRTHRLDVFEFSHNESIFIGGCDIMSINNNRNFYYLTNLVIWKEPIVVSKRSSILNQEKIKDGHLALLVDDAKEPLTLPFYGNI